LREACRQIVGDVVGAVVHLRQQRRHHLLEEPRVAPEELERLLEDRQLLAPGNENRRERLAEIGAIRDADGVDGRERVDHLRGTERQARRAQHADEIEDVLPEMACDGHHAISAFASRTSRAATSGVIACTSSWYLSSAPSVSATVCGSSVIRSRATSASAQSSVSAMPGALKRSSARNRCVNATTSHASDSDAAGHLRRTMASSRLASG